MLRPLVMVVSSAAVVAAGVPLLLADADARHSPIAPPVRLGGWTPCRGALAARTERINVDSAGRQTRTRVLRASISADGRFVAFSSASPTLVRGDRNGRVDVFVRDLLTRRTSRVSVSSSGREGDGASFFGSISGDGRFISFRSRARNLVPHDHNGVEDVFVHDRISGRTERVSVGKAVPRRRRS